MTTYLKSNFHAATILPGLVKGKVLLGQIIAVADADVAARLLTRTVADHKDRTDECSKVVEHPVWVEVTKEEFEDQGNVRETQAAEAAAKGSGDLSNEDLSNGGEKAPEEDENFQDNPPGAEQSSTDTLPKATEPEAKPAAKPAAKAPAKRTTQRVAKKPAGK